MKNNNTANAVPTGGRVEVSEVVKVIEIVEVVEVVVVGITGTNSEQLHKVREYMKDIKWYKKIEITKFIEKSPIIETLSLSSSENENEDNEKKNFIPIIQ
ncbi:hypothetical protein Glove_177g45 [Diversispora epigaea]|uniref:Uncharacterized protein n=1 Tax=Diversispora epigaea TaxID=1348612 RepID=A0A397IT96_9GLOM|nr:hypothetical protein Glove_177g45 [Diversispora epigaea]